MALQKRRKAGLDTNILQLNKWCEKVLEVVYNKYPRATVTFKTLLQLYLTGLYWKTAAAHLCRQIHTKTGG